MTTNEGLAIGGVVVGGGILIYMLSSSKKKLSAGSGSTGILAAGGLLGGLGTFINSISGGSPGGRPPAAYGTISGPNQTGPISEDSSGFGITPAEQNNVDAYDNQGDVFGIAGIDY